MFATKMTSLERRAVFSLVTILSLRMLGLFMVLPVFALYASRLPGSTATTVGIALGIYGLSQAICQIPFGTLSDRFGRKPLIAVGLSIFIIGSLMAGFANSITLLIIGRTLQGAGAVGSTILAALADLTREEQRTKTMAIAGIAIGMSFSMAMFIGPVLTQWLPIHGLFFCAALLGLITLMILFLYAPTPQRIEWHRGTEPEWHSFFQLLMTPALAKLNAGIFILHAVFTASFIVIPIRLLQSFGFDAHHQWVIYLPTLLIAFILSLIFIGIAERKHQLKPYFLVGIGCLLGANILFYFGTLHFNCMLIAIGLFFTGFSLLEAFLPSLISRTAPKERKGSALGLYSCAQFLGIFVGGALGGWIYGQYHFTGVYIFCFMLSLFWFILACFMQPPRYFITQCWQIASSYQSHWQTWLADLQSIPGMIEITFVAEENMAYLKMESKTKQHPDLIRLKAQLQSQ